MDNTNELAHHGVKGMKWGVRKAYQKTARSLGGSKFAKNAILKNKSMSVESKKKALQEQAELADEKAYNRAKKKAKKTGGVVAYDVTTKKYSVTNPDKTPKNNTKEKIAKAAKKGAQVAAKLALVSAVDDVFYGGIIKDSAKFVGKQAARGIITAWEMGVHGGYNIKWYDK